MDTSKINLFVFDKEENFKESKNSLGEEGSTLKRLICVETFRDFETQFNLLNDDDYVFLVVHVFGTKQVRGIKTFLASGIHKVYPNIEYMYISEADRTKINHDIVDAELDKNIDVYKYHEVLSMLEDEEVKAYTKRQIMNMTKEASGYSFAAKESFPTFQYAIITALYEDEFEELHKVFDFPEKDVIQTPTKRYFVGTLKSNPAKKVIAAVPNATGMVDSAIIATQMIEYFKPQYLLMSGVCGGSSNQNFGDIIVAKSIFTFQKGKLSDLNTKDGNGQLQKLELFDKDRNIVDYDHLYDGDGNLISISIEKFEREADAINIQPAIEDAIMAHKGGIKSKINTSIEREQFFSNKMTIDIKVEPMACSTMVINKAGFFEDTIKNINRKTAAVEMESYGVARACQFANEGKTIPIIFKSVMDNTANKTDFQNGVNVKKFAAYTSAQFMRYLFEDGII